MQTRRVFISASTDSPCWMSPRHIVQSSPSVIDQPRPTRGARLSLFEMKSPEPDDRSTTAQVGFARYPARAKRDDIRWSSWLKTESDMLLRRPGELTTSKNVPQGPLHPRPASPELFHQITLCHIRPLFHMQEAVPRAQLGPTVDLTTTEFSRQLLRFYLVELRIQRCSNTRTSSFEVPSNRRREWGTTYRHSDLHVW